MRPLAWFFDLDDTLHDATHAVFGEIDGVMTDYIVRELGLPHDEADRLRRHYWRRYGATLLGLEKHHGVRAAHFLEATHRWPGLEERVRCAAVDRAALRALPGRKFVLTNAPLAYAERVLVALNLADCFEAVIGIEQMRSFGQLRPKPDARMFRVVLARLGLVPSRCVLVEDTLAHQRSAHAVGLRTVWMQRYVKQRRNGPEVGTRLRRRPVYVRVRIRTLQALVGLFSR